MSQLNQLSQKQVEQALEWLEDPLPSAPPQDLEKLNQMEWFLLRRMLDSLLEEKQQNPLQ